MLLSEILSNQILSEMAYSQKKAESIITNLEKPINDHLLKLWTMPDSKSKDHWMMELENWIDEVCEIILKPDNKRPSARFYYRILFDEPFGGTGVQNIVSRLRRLQRQGYTLTTDESPQELIDRLQRFHTKFAKKAAVGPIDGPSLLSLI